MEEIISFINQIKSNLNLPSELNIEDFYEFEIYEYIYSTMFQHLSNNLETIKNSSESTGEKIQALITLLAEDILTMDLCHINGFNILTFVMNSIFI